MSYAFATHPNPAEVLRVPGYLFWNSTSLTSEAGWGTKLGFCEKGVNIEIDYGVKTLISEFGEEITQKIFLGTNVRITALLKNWNTTALSILFPGQTSLATITVPGTIVPGTSLASTTYTKALLFVPEDTANNPCAILQKSAPNFGKEFKFSRVEDTVYFCVFDGIRKTNDAEGLYYMGLIGSGVLR